MPFGVHRVPDNGQIAPAAPPAVLSPMPFGVHRVPDCLSGVFAAETLLSPMPFGVHRVPDLRRRSRRRCRPSGVTNAFRRSPRSRPQATIHTISHFALSPMPFGVHRVPDPYGVHQWALWYLQVTNAFRRSPRSRLVPEGYNHETRLTSPMPFGVHRVPDRVRWIEFITHCSTTCQEIHRSNPLFLRSPLRSPDPSQN